MDFFRKTYKECCKRQFGPQGFKNANLTFWRVVNDVVQSFYIWCNRAGNRCFLNFGITPLATGEGAGGLFPATAFPQIANFWWDFNKTSEQSVQICVSEVMQFLQQYVIPYFQRGIDCGSAFIENQNLYKNLRERKTQNGDEDEKPHKVVGGFAEYCMALKTRNWEFAKLYLKDMRALSQEATTSEEAKDIHYANMMSERVAVYSDWLAHIERHDEEFIQQFIEANERKSLEALGLVKPGRN